MTDAPDQTITFPIRETADLNLALMQVNRSGIIAPASEFDLALIRTIISELGTNIIKYGVRGQVTVCRLEAAGNIDIEVMATDAGPGITNVRLAMQDSYSTGQTLGLGLPAVKRMADHFSIETDPTHGTTVRARKRIQGTWHNKDVKSSSSSHSLNAPSTLSADDHVLWEVGTAVRPKPGEIAGGDLATYVTIPEGLLLVLIDVTGHGAKADQLSQTLFAFIKANASPNLKVLMPRIHTFLKGTQGAALSLIFIDTKLGCASYSGVGNTGASRITGHPWRPISKDGVLGLRLPTALEQKTALTNSDLILMWTDGISERTAKKYVEDNAYLPVQTLASRIVHETGKPFDDAGCLIFRWLN